MRCEVCGENEATTIVTDEAGMVYCLNPEVAQASKDGKFKVCKECASKIH